MASRLTGTRFVSNTRVGCLVAVSHDVDTFMGAVASLETCSIPDICTFFFLVVFAIAESPAPALGATSACLRAMRSCVVAQKLADLLPLKVRSESRKLRYFSAHSFSTSSVTTRSLLHIASVCFFLDLLFLIGNTSDVSLLGD